MNYTWYELGFFFFVYSFFGWCLEVCYRAFRTGKFVNRGLLGGPVCPAYGVGACLVLLALEPLGGSNIPAQLIGCVIIANIVEFFSGLLVERISGRVLPEFRRTRLSLHGMAGLLYTFIWGGLAVLGLYFVHPFVFLLSQLIPAILLRILVPCALVLLGIDSLSMCYVLHLSERERPLVQDVTEKLHAASHTLGTRIYHILRRHLCRAFPELENAKPAEGEGFGKPKNRIFARGLCLHKILWVFVLCALFGDWIETLYVFAVSGVWMSRSSVLYGTFSIVWGCGAALLTLMLSPLAEKPASFTFVGGFFLGGFYEYMCSVFTELVFGTVFWDYSDMPLNIGGRTNVLFMFFWGVLSVVWIKKVYPCLSGAIEKIPPVTGTVLTWVVVALMAADMLISGAAMLRYTARRDGTATQSAYGDFMDQQYPDSLIEWTWPNMSYTQ